MRSTLGEQSKSPRRPFGAPRLDFSRFVDAPERPLSHRFFEPVPQGAFFKVPWLVIDPYWLHSDYFGYLLGSILASETLPFGLESVKHLQTTADTPR